MEINYLVNVNKGGGEKQQQEHIDERVGALTVSNGLSEVQPHYPMVSTRYTTLLGVTDPLTVLSFLIQSFANSSTDLSYTAIVVVVTVVDNTPEIKQMFVRNNQAESPRNGEKKGKAKLTEANAVQLSAKQSDGVTERRVSGINIKTQDFHNQL
ncbi:hypothetical protein CBL_12405 [Carabus blaptoides fortunei]